MEESIDASELLARVQRQGRTTEWSPLLPDDVIGEWREATMRGFPDLGYLHEHWAISVEPDANWFGSGLKRSIKRVVARMVRSVLKGYLRDERELHAHLVRCVDALSRRCDELVEALARRQVADAHNGALLAARLRHLEGAHRDGAE